MIIENRKVVAFHYTLTSDKGDELESSRGRQPMYYLHGSRNIIPGLEKAMAGRTAGEQFQVTIEPADAYGERDEDRLQRIPTKKFGNTRNLKAGQFVSLQTKQGPVQAVVVKVGRFNVDVDMNHPLAGQTLTFDVEISDVRDATAEEISHGHVHGPGGVDH
ncbi:MAG: peptidylprolyl isomerase [Xanthomonadales bacterium]|nr:peptidylprolyl isomerase [Gammaproteobacteria bacterium]NNJ64377.1 peptidylprolyl isomerase [Xanthomonadales bacterium]NNK37462.1 peptidylprolyl isomerase [Xanthomonadales bacterium]